jgi:hypothetical protein
MVDVLRREFGHTPTLDPPGFGGVALQQNTNGLPAY